MATKQQNIIKVRFIATDQVEYFSTLSAIYEVYTREDIGITLPSLQIARLPYGNRKCSITRVPVHHKTQERMGAR